MVNEAFSSQEEFKNYIRIDSSDGQITLAKFTQFNAEGIYRFIANNRAHLSQFGDDTSAKYPHFGALIDSIVTPKNPKRLRFMIEDNADGGRMVGSINLTPDDKDPTQAEIGYYLGAEFQKKGYMGKAVETLTNYGFNVLDYQTIYGDVVEANLASAKVLIKAGFQETGRHDGKIRYSKQAS